MEKLLFLIVIFVGAGLISTSYSKTISLETMPAELSVRKGSKIILKLRTNPAVADWHINIQNPENNNVLVKIDEYHKSRNKMIMDGDETLMYIVKTQNKGISKISGNYTRFLAKDEDPLESFSLTVTVK